MAKRFKMKQKPEKPERRQLQIDYSLDNIKSGSNLLEVLEQLREWGNAHGVTYVPELITLSEDNCYDHSYWKFTFHYPEPEDQYIKRLETYKEKLAEFIHWQTENKEAIEDFLRNKLAKEEARKAKELKDLRKKKQQIEDQLAMLEARFDLDEWLPSL